ncbi:MAG TPA: hypothetical protein VFA76_02425 [Terriglobales bacterium]|nr:hypothetical protein [Terriglobales bacterium]
MSYATERLTSLRQEITDLRNMNTQYSAQSAHSPTDKSALEERAGRLLQIKQELSAMLNHSDNPAIWWDKTRKPTRAA